MSVATEVDNLMSGPTNMGSLVSATLSLRSRELRPSVITEQLGLTPMRTKLRGEPVSKGRPELGSDPDNYWAIEAQRPIERGDALFVDEDSSTQLLRAAIEELLDKIEPVGDKLLQLPVSVTLMCAYRAVHAPQWFVLPNSLVRRLAALNIEVMVFWTSPDQKSEVS